MPIKQGDTIPDTTFNYIPWSKDIQDGKASGSPTSFKAHELWKGKKVVIVSIPGAFTPVCHMSHIPGFISKLSDIKAKGYEVVIIAANDPFVMSAWRVNMEVEDKILFATDANAEFSKQFGASVDIPENGFGVRTARYALVINDLKVEYFGKDDGDLKDSSVEAVLLQLK
ncbi:peroxiredoxin type-2 [Malassezia vespertilionis]|uniref:Putative peroxiredoxin n=1 Tax=Malassezia vespertilionis TaxID=2020962 RepID=A0A2N1JCI4_9BASI|nr:peroxiredoxin type-2 [Malassezia vespertilionis]PKI84254.1 hypothetical protein MVES_001407 [Malassezia vespertilionis]WFD06152.1 peroxiredoxin type-2 [Malassezia vespertilionis]